MKRCVIIQQSKDNGCSGQTSAQPYSFSGSQKAAPAEERVIRKENLMPRNMSFALTTDQIKNRTKTVTRRNGWWFLNPGDIVNAVEKAMGLKKGEKIKRICQIRIVSTEKSVLESITDDDVVREGFPGWSRNNFVDMYTAYNKCSGNHIVNRIEFKYV